MDERDIVVRVSIGSLYLLNKTDLRLGYEPSTLYMLQYSPDGCLAGCRYCSQSRFVEVSKKYLSRITWYPVKLGEIVDDIDKVFERICLQTIVKKMFIQEALTITGFLREHGVSKPVSVASTPVHPIYLEKLWGLGVDYLGVGLDTASSTLFNKYGKPYSWDTYMWFIDNALKIFGEGRVVAHLIVGLGEEPHELYGLMMKLLEKGVDVALFPYLDIHGFKPSVNLSRYREAQIVRYFLSRGYGLKELINGDGLDRDILEMIIDHVDEYREIFYTSGCPYCNRPYYTENPRGPFYNIYGEEHYMDYREKLVEELRTMLGWR